MSFLTLRGAYAVGGKDSREKWLCISYTPAPPARRPPERLTPGKARRCATLGGDGQASQDGVG
jgi:hypothetical protein